MNKYRLVWIGVSIMIALMLTGCAQSAITDEITEAPAVEAPVEEEAAYPVEEEVQGPAVAYPAEEGVQDDEDARMEALISEKINDCHVLNFILQQDKTREEWSVTIDRMIGKGAQVNAEEKELIINWLVSREP